MKSVYYLDRAAESHYDLGFSLGRFFAKETQGDIVENFSTLENPRVVEQSLRSLEATKKALPLYVEELEGYAKGSDVSLRDLWILSLEDEFSSGATHCTTLYNPGAGLIGHDEDWKEGSENTLVILRRALGDLTSLELYYRNTLGGNALSINSKGLVHAGDTLAHNTDTIGIPRNVISRYVLDASSINEAVGRLKEFSLGAGCHHFFYQHGRAVSVETAGSRVIAKDIAGPFAHTNCYTYSELLSFENEKGIELNRQRLQNALGGAESIRTAEECKRLLHTGNGRTNDCLYNAETIASVVLDMPRSVGYIWLKRESEAGWLPYSLLRLTN